ncbi:PXA domain-containing protein [Microdochium trichocladiopsis]|uniref:PXA domain-containing protein n=1 Tax=Microdochium trichocladiopsis TaxID=1682393 RepID=A0A9P9BMS0_9PEZI|nr:PXA domain-containing protein [Microdochium trichocladiopsis]KAH7026171.1 PXA domain-containing protein [Microdochium trichocladiopsis]
MSQSAEHASCAATQGVLPSDAEQATQQPVTLNASHDVSDKTSSDSANAAAPLELDGDSHVATKGAAAGSQPDDLTTKLLDFLATATPEMLGGVAVGCAALTYLVLGQVGLLLVGAFGGIAAFATLERNNPELSRAVRGQKGHDFLETLLETAKAKVSKDSVAEEANDDSSTLRSFDDFQPETRDALNEFVDATVRDYVNWWYHPIVPSDKSFALSCRKTMTSYILAMSNQLGRKRPADSFVDFLTHSCSIIIVFFSEMANAYNELSVDSNASATDAIYNYLSTNTDSPLSNLLNQKQQAAKFKMVAEDLLTFLDKQSYDCEMVRVFMREIMATIALEGTLQTCSKAEWINAWIVYLLESGETDLSQAIDEAIEQKAFGDIDGNVGNIGLSKGNRNSYDMDRARRKEQTHKKKLSKADEEMERAMEEMKRLNQMIADADQTKNGDTPKSSSEAPSAMDDVPPLMPPRPSVEGGMISPRESQDHSVSSRNSGISTIGHSQGFNDAASLPSQQSQEMEMAESPPPPHQAFTSFDQFVPPAQEEPMEGEARKPIAPLTLHNASITIHDDIGNEKGQLRSKPTWEYLIQIEPASNQHSGWMIMKTYAQFEALHESLRRIAAISGSAAFLEAHSTLPSWKVHTRSSLRGEIERYLSMACVEKPLAESEALKRFLEKGQTGRMPANRGFSFESVGKGMLDVLQNAPKGALDSGKVVVGGVTGVFGNIGLGPRRSTNSSNKTLQEPVAPSPPRSVSPRPLSLPVLPRMESGPPAANGTVRARDSIDSQHSVISVQPGKMAPMERRPSTQVDLDTDVTQHMRADRWDMKSPSTSSSRVHSRASSMAARRSPLRSPSETSLANLRLPPLPTEMSDDYDSPITMRHSLDGSRLLSPRTLSNSPSHTSLHRVSASVQEDKPPLPSRTQKRIPKQHVPLTEAETRVAVELLFAVINELYTLSSAWNIRRTLLTAAKSFLLRPGNPSMNSIQTLIQHSLIDTNTTDDGIAAHIRKLRENTLPTEEERAAWPAEMTAEEKEELRVKARRLFIQSSVPGALMGIMGQSATSAALGRVFDCLQIEEVARGLFFGLMLQAVRVITH